MHQIGSSEWSIPLGLQRTRHDGLPFVSELELWSRLSGLTPRYRTDIDTPDAEIGRWMEPIVGNRYAVEHQLQWGTDILPGPPFPGPSVTHERIPWGSTRPDFYVPARARTLEAKCPRRLEEERWGPAGTDQVPPDHAVQMIGQLAFAWLHWGFEDADLAAFARAPGYGSDRVWATYTIRRDPALERDVLDGVGRWYERHVVGGVPPEPDGSPSASDTLRSLWRGAEGVRMRATAEVEELAWKLIQTRTAQQEIAHRRAELEQQIQAAMGEAVELVDHRGERFVTWRPDGNGRRRFKVWRKDVAE